MKEISLLVLLLLSFWSCDIKSLRSTQLKKQFLESEKFGIRDKPILNREYLIFLSWYIDVYGRSYPEKIIQVLPEGTIDIHQLLKRDYTDLAKASTGILKDYILNPKYLDYPLLGLNPNQVLEMDKWLQDRYNENCLIELGIYNFTPNQANSDSFSTEAYLAGQYVGGVRNEVIPDWQNGFFLAAFRLPFKEELAALPIAQKQNDLIRSYSFTKKDFLWRWNEFYLTENEVRKELILHAVEDLKLTSTSDYPIAGQTLEAAILQKEKVFSDPFLPPLEVLKTMIDFTDYPFKEKDKYGHMDFTIIGTSEAGKPIAVEGTLIAESHSGKDKVFWLAYSKTLVGVIRL